MREQDCRRTPPPLVGGGVAVPSRLDEVEMAGAVISGSHVLAIGTDGVCVVSEYNPVQGPVGGPIRDPEQVRAALVGLAIRVLMDEFSDIGAGQAVPLGDRVLLLPLAEDGEPASTGILITLDREPSPHRSLVLAVGPGYRLKDGSGWRPIEVEVGVPLEVGDTVITGAHVGHPVVAGGKVLRMVQGADVLAVLRRPEDDELRLLGHEHLR